MTVRLLTNIENIYYAFIEKEAKLNNTSKRSIVEKAIDNYMKEKEKKALEQAYINMGKDGEYLDEMVDNTNYLSYL